MLLPHKLKSCVHGYLHTFDVLIDGVFGNYLACTCYGKVKKMLICSYKFISFYGRK